jgi:hypothetical protein
MIAQARPVKPRLRPPMGLPAPWSRRIVLRRRGRTRTTVALVGCGPGFPGASRVGYPVPATQRYARGRQLRLDGHPDKTDQGGLVRGAAISPWNWPALFFGPRRDEAPEQGAQGPVPPDPQPDAVCNHGLLKGSPMIPRKNRRKQSRNTPRTRRPPGVMVPTHANDAEPGPSTTPLICPTCGRATFGPQSSGLLDLVVLIHESAGTLKAALETVVVP